MGMAEALLAAAKIALVTSTELHVVDVGPVDEVGSPHVDLIKVGGAYSLANWASA